MKTKSIVRVIAIVCLLLLVIAVKHPSLGIGAAIIIAGAFIVL